MFCANISGEHLQDHWSSGFIRYAGMYNVNPSFTIYNVGFQSV